MTEVDKVIDVDFEALARATNAVIAAADDLVAKLGTQAEQSAIEVLELTLSRYHVVEDAQAKLFAIAMGTD